MRDPLFKSFVIFDVIALLLTIGLSCGPLNVDHNVSGTVQVQLSENAALYLPFFLTDCQTRQPSQACYDSDPTVCAQCMATALVASLPTIK